MAQALLQAVHALREQRLRSGLTALGMVIGVAAVVTILSLGQGLRANVLETLGGLGIRLLWVYPQPQSALEVVRNQPLNTDDFETLVRRVPGVVGGSPFLQTQLEVRGPGGHGQVPVIGVSSDFIPMRKLSLSRGRPFSRREVDRRERVAIAGSKVAARLLPPRAIGEVLHLGGVPYEVVGVLAPRQGGMGSGDVGDDAVLVPYSALQRQVGSREVPVLFLSAAEGASLEEVRAGILEHLGRRHPGSRYNVESLDQIIRAVDGVLSSVTTATAAIGAVSLIVSGFGVFNVLLMSVTERTKEIGIRKAVGASRRDILWQFLLEAVLLSVAGGGVGMAVGLAISLAIAYFVGWPLRVPVSALAGPFLFTLAIGVAFGTYPADRAARLDPVEAIRRE